MSFSFREKKEIEIDFPAEKICILKDKIIIFSNENLYFINEKGEIVFSIPIFGFERGKVSELVDLQTCENEIFILGKGKVLRYNSYGEFIEEFRVNLPQRSFIGALFPFGIFVFDGSLNKVKRYGFDGREKGEFYVKGEDIKDMEIDGDYIYFLTEDGKVLIHNFYGNRVDEFKLIPGKKIEINEGLIFLLDDGNLHVFDKDKKIYSEKTRAKDICFENDNLYILSRDIQIREVER